MLVITIPEVENFDEVSNEFISMPETILQLEHSLASISKWESVWEKPFLGPGEKTEEEIFGYIKAMTLTPDVPPEIYAGLTADNYAEINEYIGAKMSATWFSEKTNRTPNREVVTSELIYHWMIQAQIPFEFDQWHVSRLFTLIKVIGEKNAPKKKINPRDLAARNRELNAARKAQHNTTG